MSQQPQSVFTERGERTENDSFAKQEGGACQAIKRGECAAKRSLQTHQITRTDETQRSGTIKEGNCGRTVLL
jgi:hypothetical protein